MLTNFELDDFGFGARHAGASGFRLKDINADDCTPPGPIRASVACLIRRDR